MGGGGTLCKVPSFPVYTNEACDEGFIFNAMEKVSRGLPRIFLVRGTTYKYEVSLTLCYH